MPPGLLPLFNNPIAMTELEKYIQTYFGVSNDELEKIISFFEPVTLKKNDYFLKTGILK